MKRKIHRWLVRGAALAACGLAGCTDHPDSPAGPSGAGGAGTTTGTSSGGSGGGSAGTQADAATLPDAPLNGPPDAEAEVSVGDASDAGRAMDAAFDGGFDPSRGDPYNFAPRSRVVVPKAVLSTKGSVTNPNDVLSGKTTTLSGAGAQIVLDFGQEVGGILSLQFAGASGNPSLGVAFSESALHVGPNSDNSAGGSNSDGALAVSVAGAMSWTSAGKYLRGGFRYVTLFFTSAGSIHLQGVSLAFSPDPERAIPNQYPNYFYSNDDVLN